MKQTSDRTILMISILSVYLSFTFFRTNMIVGPFCFVFGVILMAVWVNISTEFISRFDDIDCFDERRG